MMPIASPPVRGTSLLCIFRSAGKSRSQSLPTFMRKAENQTVKERASVNGVSASIKLLGSVQDTFDSVGDFFHNLPFLKSRG